MQARNLRNKLRFFSSRRSNQTSVDSQARQMFPITSISSNLNSKDRLGSSGLDLLYKCWLFLYWSTREHLVYFKTNCLIYRKDKVGINNKQTKQTNPTKMCGFFIFVDWIGIGIACGVVDLLSVPSTE